MNTEKAIKYFEDEIRFCEYSPAGNPVHAATDWVRVLDANRSALAALKEKQDRENPAPLTNDELRQMFGEPVWCIYEGGSSWFVVTDSLFTVINGITAYRHKPEEVQA